MSRDDVQLLAERLLQPLGNRWIHTKSVAAQASALVKAVPPHDQGLLVAAAWCHDLGYAPELATTGFHPLDGARFLTKVGYPTRLCQLVAHHSAATFEAHERGLSAELAEWEDEKSAVTDALWMADMTTGPQGQRLDYPTRLAEVLDRYGVDSPVGVAMRRAREEIEGAITRTRRRLTAT